MKALGVFHATPLILHCLEAWSSWGKPAFLKTDNGSAYTLQKFAQFCSQMHITGLCYNPQGQEIIERAHCTLKTYFLKQKGGIMAELPPVARMSIAMALFMC